MAVQEWVTALGKDLAPATMAKCFGVLRQILRSAIRARLIAVDPTDGVTVPSTYQARPLAGTITREVFLGKLLPAVPAEHRAIVALAGGAGLRWGEAAGLAWGAVDLAGGMLRVVQVAVETSGSVTIKPYPKSRAGIRRVPIPDFLVEALQAHRFLTVLGDEPPSPQDLVCKAGTALRCAGRTSGARSGGRRWYEPVCSAASRSWAPTSGGPPGRTRPAWSGAGSTPPSGRRSLRSPSRRTAGSGSTICGTRTRPGSSRTVCRSTSSNGWMGHEQAPTTLNRYTHTPDDYGTPYLLPFGDPAASVLPRSLNEPGK